MFGPRHSEGYRLQHISDQVLWSSASATFPSYIPVTWYAFGRDNLIYESSLDTDYQAHQLDTEEFLGPINNPEGKAAICLISFVGSIVSIAPDPNTGIVTNPLQCYAFGMPYSGPSIQEQDGFVDTPIGETVHTAPPAELVSRVADGLGVGAFTLHSWAPFFGNNPSADHRQSSPQLLTKFLVGHGSGSAGDPFHLTFPIGKLSSGMLSVSGYSKMSLRLRLAFGQEDPFPVTELTIAGNVVASLYEVIQ